MIGSDSLTMKADLDFDIVAHFGNFRNVDLLSKGIYIVQTKLYYGVEGTLIAPVGMFSSPSTVCSTVQSQTLPPVPVCSMCEVHDGLRCFRTRSLIIRYKDEKYELNDGVHWRLTLPACNVATDDNPACPRPLHLKFELLYAPFLPMPVDVKVNLMTEIHKLVPDDPLYSIIATQNVVIERAGSGIHAYYPVHFNGSNIAELDCMVHCAITGIRFPTLSPQPSTGDAVADPTEGSDPPLPSPPNLDRVLPPLPPSAGETPVDSPAGNPSAAVTTPVKPTPTSDEAGETSERDGTLSSFTPVRSEETSSSASVSLGASPRTQEDFAPSIGSKRSSQRYVPVVSPLTTKLETAGETATAKPSAMKRMGGHISNLRNSITQSVRSPVPMMGKAAEASVAGARKLGALTSALTSPIATRLRFDHHAGGAGGAAGSASGAGGGASEETLPMADESITPARAEEQGVSIVMEPVSLDLSEEGAAEGQAEETAKSPVDGPASPDDSDEQRPALIEAAEMLAPQLDPILDPEGWLDSYAHSVVANYKAMHSGIRAILDLYAHVQRDDPAKLGGDQAQAQALQASCLFESERSAIMAEILLCAEEAERRAVVKEKVDLSNLQVTLHWSLLMTALRRVMPQLCPLLKEDYRRAARAFWRGQILIQTKSFVGTTAYLPQETHVLLDLIGILVARDEAHGVTAVGSTGNRHSDASCAFAAHRKLRVYDVDMMQRVAKLPHMVLQQYFSHEDASKVDIVRLNAKLAAEKEGQRSAPQQQRLEPSKLRYVLQAVRDALARGATLPPGTLYLSRGGELLEEAVTGGLGDGQVLDIARYPALVPALPQILGDGARDVEKPSSDSTVTTLEASSERDGVDGGAGAEKPSSSGNAYAHDFVAEHQRLVAAGKAASPVHLVVLQHGFLGQGYDMQMIENALRLELGFAVETFVPRSNEGKEHDSIAQLGKRLAFELVQYCKEYHPELLQPGTRPRVSFIGHSMGGLIVRQALTESTLKPLHSKLHAYVSLATPHVGALFPDSKIVSTGMWALFKWKKYKALKELVLEDSLGGKASKTLLFKLAESNTLSHFRKVVLLSSPKDQYVPVYSARIQTSPRSESNHETGAVVSQMVHNILHPLRAEQVVRITMDNNVGEGVGVNSLIGRTAHICYLENPVAAKALVYSIAAYLQ